MFKLPFTGRCSSCRLPGSVQAAIYREVFRLPFTGTGCRLPGSIQGGVQAAVYRQVFRLLFRLPFNKLPGGIQAAVYRPGPDMLPFTGRCSGCRLPGDAADFFFDILNVLVVGGSEEALAPTDIVNHSIRCVQMILKPVLMFIEGIICLDGMRSILYKSFIEANNANSSLQAHSCVKDYVNICCRYMADFDASRGSIIGEGAVYRELCRI